MKLESLEVLFLEELKDIYDAEQQLTKALPKMAKAASSTELRGAFEHHLKETKNHTTRLEQIFEQLGEKAKASKCEGIRGIIEEGEDIIDGDGGPSVMDAGLIAGAQKAEHYEIATYGSLRTYAQTLGHNEAAQLLQETLEEEKAADKKLTEIAEGFINRDAAQAA
jgi:ferritin-like metal-binding protein YciE